jgi:hypothetical protein
MGARNAAGSGWCLLAAEWASRQKPAFEVAGLLAHLAWS